MSNGFHVHFTDSQTRNIIAGFVIVLLVVLTLGMLGVFKCDDNPTPAPNFSKHELAPPNTQGAHELGKATGGLPDIQILTTGNSYGVRGLADDLSGIDSTGMQYLCPFGVFNGGFITDDSAKMVNFLEIKCMKIDSLGNELFFSETYKSQYHFEASCLSGLTCTEQFSTDTIFAGQEDEYFNRTTVAGAGNYIVAITINSQGLQKECPGCGNNTYFFGFTYAQVPTPYGFSIWDAERNDALLTNSLKAKLKNHK